MYVMGNKGMKGRTLLHFIVILFLVIFVMVVHAERTISFHMQALIEGYKLEGNLPFVTALRKSLVCTITMHTIHGVTTVANATRVNTVISLDGMCFNITLFLDSAFVRVRCFRVVLIISFCIPGSERLGEAESRRTAFHLSCSSVLRCL